MQERMNVDPSLLTEVTALRGVVEGFLNERALGKLEPLDKKLEKLRDQGEGASEEFFSLTLDRQKAAAVFEREVWLVKAASRAKQIRVVTHAPKFSHPDAKGSGINLREPVVKSTTNYVGTHVLGVDVEFDVVGNAASLDVYKLLAIEHDGESLLQRSLRNDDALAAAMSDDVAMARTWLAAFAQITEPAATLASHGLAKQIYFPVADGEYHILSPLFPSSLAQRIHRELREYLFTESTKQARDARKSKKHCEHSYHDYLDVAVTTFGGTKPQNISQLNSVRRGEHRMLSCLPPTWKRREVNPPLAVKSVFGAWFGRRVAVKSTLRTLVEFLKSTDYNNYNIRRRRAQLVAQLCDELVQFAGELLEAAGGWSAGADCKLDRNEALWLDPGRAQDDRDFAQDYEDGLWQKEVAKRFANWLNAQLKRRGGLALGDAEQAAWTSEAYRAITFGEMEVSDAR